MVWGAGNRATAVALRGPTRPSAGAPHLSVSLTAELSGRLSVCLFAPQLDVQSMQAAKLLLTCVCAGPAF